MLATQSPFYVTPFTPSRSSPLSERSANACQRRYTSAVMLHSFDAKQNVPFSKRPIKEAPIIRNKEEIRDKRRDLFLKKVRDSRNDKNWDARGDQILRMDFMKEKKKWESDKARSAPTLEDYINEDEESDDPPTFSSNPLQVSPSRSITSSSSFVYDEAAEAEAALQREEEEFEAMLELMEEQENVAEEPYMPSQFGSDDEDYDTLFTEYLSSQQPNDSNASNNSLDTMEDAMDMS